MYHLFVYIIEKIKSHHKKLSFDPYRMLLTDKGWIEFEDSLEEYKHDLYNEVLNELNNNKNDNYIDIVFHTIYTHLSWYYDYIEEKNKNKLIVLNQIFQELVKENCRIQELFPMIDFDDEENITETLYDIKFDDMMDFNCVFTKMNVLNSYKKDYPKEHHRLMLAYNKKYHSANIIQRNFKYVRYRPSEYKLGFNIVSKNLELENIILKN